MRMAQGVRTGLGHGGIICVLQTQFSSFALYLRFYLIDKCHTSCTSSVSHCESPHIFLLVTVTYISWSSRFLPCISTLPNRKASYFGYLFGLLLSMTIFL